MSKPEKIDEVFKRLSFYVVPVISLGSLKVDWRIVIAESEDAAKQQVEADIEEHGQQRTHPNGMGSLYISETYMTRWIGPADVDSIEALGNEAGAKGQVSDEGDRLRAILFNDVTRAPVLDPNGPSCSDCHHYKTMHSEGSGCDVQFQEGEYAPIELCSCMRSYGPSTRRTRGAR